MNALALVVSAALAQASTITVTPVADTSLDSRAGQANVGNAATISADRGSGWRKDAYLRFEVPPQLGLVTKAVLRLRVANGSPGGGALYLSRSSKAWSEASTANPKDPDFEIAHFGALAAGDTLEKDVTQSVSAGLPLDVHIGSETGDGLAFESREGTHPPQLVVTSIPSQTAGTVVIAEADTYASQHNPSANHAADETVFADANDGLHQDVAFIRFPIAPARGGHTVKRATIRLFVTNGSTGRVSILPFGDVLGARWHEDKLTWDNLPRHGVMSPMKPRQLQGLEANTWLELDATEAARDNDYLTLQIATATADGIGFSSREAPAHKPELLLELGP